MNRVLILLVVAALLIPGIVGATATMGVYFAPGVMSYSPTAFNQFQAYLYLNNADYYVTAVEYQLQTPSDPSHAFFTINSVEYPDNVSVTLGDPFSGHSISFWPPLNGILPGYNLVCTYNCYTFEPCWNDGGQLVDYPLVIGPHPDSGELRGTYSPDNNTFPIIGMTSILCPQEIANEQESWGAIKSLYK